MPATDDDIVHLYERCADVFGPWAAATLMRCFGGRAVYVLDRELGLSWHDAAAHDPPATSDSTRRRRSAPEAGTAASDDDALSMFARLIDVLGRRAAVTLAELLQPPMADALDRRLAGWRDLAAA